LNKNYDHKILKKKNSKQQNLELKSQIQQAFKALNIKSTSN